MSFVVEAVCGLALSHDNFAERSALSRYFDDRILSKDATFLRDGIRCSPDSWFKDVERSDKFFDRTTCSIFFSLFFLIDFELHWVNWIIHPYSSYLRCLQLQLKYIHKFTVAARSYSTIFVHFIKFKFVYLRHVT